MAIDRVYVDGDYVQFRDSAGDFVTAIHYSEFSYFNDNGDIKFLHRRDQAALYPITSVNFLDVKDAAGTPYVTAPQDLDDFLAAFIALLPTVGGGGGGGTAPDIATYDVQVDTGVSYDTFIRVLTVFDPVTNLPTRTFTTLAGAPYTPTNPALVMPFVNLPLEQPLSNINNNIGILRDNSDNIRVELGLDAIVGDTLPQESFLAIRNSGSYTVDTAKTRKIQIIPLTGTFNVSGVTFPLTTATGGVIADYSVEATPARSVKLTYEVDAASTVLEVVLRG